MPILDDLIEGEPHALHSLDPQAGVDIKEVKRLVGKRVCLMGNVNCGLMQTGTPEQVVGSAEYALKHGMPGGGYIFSTSNCVFTGLPLERYLLILDVWKEKGWYSAKGKCR
jgi:uroporphyrinogen decarboxylase